HLREEALHVGEAPEHGADADTRARRDLLRGRLEDPLAHQLEQRVDDRLPAALGATDPAVGRQRGGSARRGCHDRELWHSLCQNKKATHEACAGSGAGGAMAIHPTTKQIESLMARPADQPVVMVNLLRFKPRADAPDEGISGEEAYRRYAEPMRTFVESRGGRFLWVGRVDSQVIGSGGEGFHMIGLVEYPSREAFLAIATDPHVQEIGIHRAAGLESQWLIAATTVK